MSKSNASLNSQYIDNMTSYVDPSTGQTYWPKLYPSYPPPPYPHSPPHEQKFRQQDWIQHVYGQPWVRTYPVNHGANMTQHAGQMSGNISGQDNCGYQETIEDQSTDQEVADEEETELEQLGMFTALFAKLSSIWQFPLKLS